MQRSKTRANRLSRFWSSLRQGHHTKMYHDHARRSIVPAVRVLSLLVGQLKERLRGHPTPPLVYLRAATSPRRPPRPKHYPPRLGSSLFAMFARRETPVLPFVVPVRGLEGATSAPNISNRGWAESSMYRRPVGEGRRRLCRHPRQAPCSSQVVRGGGAGSRVWRVRLGREVNGTVGPRL